MSRRVIGATGPALFAAFAALGIAGLLFPDLVSAHALVGKQDLPIPPGYFFAGIALILVISFVGLAFAWQKPLLEQDGFEPFSERISGIFVNPLTQGLAGLIGVGLLGVVIWSGLSGTEAPDRNFNITFVFVTFWLGMVALSFVFGDVFRAFNPWRAIARVAGASFQRIAGPAAPDPLPYPEKLGRWPAALGLIGFLWFELVWGESGFGAAGIDPRTVAIATLIYSVVTFVGMALYGVEKWIERGETFSVYFNMFSRLAILGVKEGRLGTRNFLASARDWALVPGSLAVLMITIGGTTFDGASEGLLKEPISTVFTFLRDDLSLDATFSLRASNTLFLIGTVLAVSGVFWLGITGMTRAIHEQPMSVSGYAGRFAHVFIPIALAYLAAHYYTLVLYQEQAQFTYLLSDPLGDGSDFFGTAGSGIDYGIVSANQTWYFQVGALGVGHVLALAMAHDRALTIFKSAREAARSQYWMLGLMIAFSVFGLVLLNQANQ